MKDKENLESKLTTIKNVLVLAGPMGIPYKTFKELKNLFEDQKDIYTSPAYEEAIGMMGSLFMGISFILEGGKWSTYYGLYKLAEKIF
ncbi:MAG: hypothetical protein AABY07_00145 [Nanoarchaeota archaeon]